VSLEVLRLGGVEVVGLVSLPPSEGVMGLVTLASGRWEYVGGREGVITGGGEGRPGVL